MSAPVAARVPEPALVRGLLVAVTSILAVVLGHAVSTTYWVEIPTDIYAGLAPLLAGILIRRAVVPASKVVSVKLETGTFHPPAGSRPNPGTGPGAPAIDLSGS